MAETLNALHVLHRTVSSASFCSFLHVLRLAWTAFSTAPCCCAFGCRTRENDGKRLFRIPSANRDAARRKIWLQRIGRADLIPTQWSRLCEDHFTADSQELRGSAVPSCSTPFESPQDNSVAGCMDADPTSISLQSSLQDASAIECHSSTLYIGGVNCYFTIYNLFLCCSDVDFTCPLLQNLLQGIQTPSTSTSYEALPATVTDVDESSSKEAFCAADEAALHKRIAELEDELKSHKRKLSICQRQKNAALQEKSALKRRTCHFLANGQLKSMERYTMRGTPWSASTIEKGLKIRLSCGSWGYNVVREIGTPLPSERTLHRHLEDLKFLPGILHEILPSLSVKVNLMKDHEKHAVLILDEMQLTPGIAYDQGTETVIGKPTIPLSNGTLPDNVMAMHGLVFMLAGVTTRWKQTVAYHLTSNSFCSNTVKHVILEIIKSCESIGIKIDAIVCDMGGGNQALWKEFRIVVGRHCRSKCKSSPE
ncbi:uncharacterized protein LOC144129138 [Amblyomma americanum]